MDAAKRAGSEQEVGELDVFPGVEIFLSAKWLELYIGLMLDLRLNDDDAAPSINRLGSCVLSSRVAISANADGNTAPSYYLVSRNLHLSLELFPTSRTSYTELQYSSIFSKWIKPSGG